MERERNGFRVKKAVSVFLTVLAAFLLGMPVLAAEKEYTIPEMDNMTVQVPDDLFVFTQDLDPTDPNMIAAGYTDIISKGNEFRENNIYLNVVGENGSPNVVIAKKESSRTREVYNLSLLSDAEFEEFLDEMRGDEEEQAADPSMQTMEYTVERYDTPNQPFFVLELSMDSTDQLGRETTITELCYSTIINGYSITIDTYNENGPISDEARQLAQSIADSAEFPIVNEKPEQTEGSSTALGILIMAAPILVIVIIIAIPIVISRISAKRIKKQRAIMADKLETYRKEQLEKERLAAERGTQPEEPETRFANVTQYSDAAIKKFCMYHCFRKRINVVIVYFLCGIFCLAVGVLGADLSWFLRILLFALFVFCIAWPLYMPRKMIASQIRVYKKYRSRTALYYFRDEDFRISELQSASVYPYFQITSVRESKDYFYLYFNDEQVYYVRKDGFKFGTVDEFRKFIHEKTS